MTVITIHEPDAEPYNFSYDPATGRLTLIPF